MAVSRTHSVQSDFTYDFCDSILVPSSSASILASWKGDSGNKSYIRISMFFLCLKYLFQIFVKLSGKSCIQLRTVSLIRFHIGFLKFFFFSEKIHLFSTLDLPRGRLSDPLNTDEYHGNARNFNLELGTIMIWYFCTFQENTYNRKHPWNDRKGMLSSNSKYWF